MIDNIIIINGPNLNLLGKREQSQYGSITFERLKENCLKKSKELNIKIEFVQSNIEGDIVTIIQKAREKYVLAQRKAQTKTKHRKTQTTKETHITNNIRKQTC